jgi:hypothetical protein
MRLGDWLIVSGVVLVPLVLSVATGIGALVGGEAANPAISITSLVVAVAIGLITAGILLRKNK